MEIYVCKYINIWTNIWYIVVLDFLNVYEDAIIITHVHSPTPITQICTHLIKRFDYATIMLCHVDVQLIFFTSLYTYISYLQSITCSF